jgi:hypothetical protein
LGNYLFDKFDDEYHTENEGYIAHIDSTLNPPTLFFATTKLDFRFNFYLFK